MESLKEQNEQINKLSINMEEAITNALACYRACMSCLQHCLSMGGRHSEPRHITLMMECAEICQTSARFMIESSDFAHDICGVCARICDACGDSCHEIGKDDAQMRACMIACKNCADSCRNMEH